MQPPDLFKFAFPQQLANTEEYVDGALAGHLGEVLIRYVVNLKHLDKFSRGFCILVLSLYFLLLKLDYLK